MYYYIDKEGNQKGPVSAESLKANGVTDNTPVWKAGMEQWTQAKDVPELRSFFHLPQTPPPPPVPPTPPFTQGYSKSADSNASYNKAAQAQAQTASPAEMPKPDNYLVWSILCTICCCTPLGIYKDMLHRRSRGWSYRQHPLWHLLRIVNVLGRRDLQPTEFDRCGTEQNNMDRRHWGLCHHSSPIHGRPRHYSMEPQMPHAFTDRIQMPRMRHPKDDAPSPAWGISRCHQIQLFCRAHHAFPQHAWLRTHIS